MIEIYYVEDDKTIATTVKEYLNQKGYAVFVFETIESGKKAFERKRQTIRSTLNLRRYYERRGFPHSSGRLSDHGIR